MNTKRRRTPTAGAQDGHNPAAPERIVWTESRDTIRRTFLDILDAADPSGEWPRTRQRLESTKLARIERGIVFGVDERADPKEAGRAVEAYLRSLRPARAAHRPSKLDELPSPKVLPNVVEAITSDVAAVWKDARRLGDVSALAAVLPHVKGPWREGPKRDRAEALCREAVAGRVKNPASFARRYAAIWLDVDRKTIERALRDITAQRLAGSAP
jgi:hypothetical protein